MEGRGIPREGWLISLYCFLHKWFYIDEVTYFPLQGKYTELITILGTPKGDQGLNKTFIIQTYMQCYNPNADLLIISIRPDVYIPCSWSVQEATFINNQKAA